ncbi:MAG: hypothetical protein KC444_06910 [Nitrosopumilus sp.]|nr:hypothetical protein [Nitrosopumilus sp.]
MNKSSYGCCHNPPEFLIQFQISEDKVYQVCKECYTLPQYSRGIKTKKEIEDVSSSLNPLKTPSNGGFLINV